MNDNIDQIISNVDIVQNIGEVVSLKRSGENFIGQCPFHNEKSPSFVVSPIKKIFKCFGCGTGGNVITFNIKLNNSNFKEVIEKLSLKYNLELKIFKSQNKNQNIDILNDALNFFKSNLFDKRGQKGLNYLLNERSFDLKFLKDNDIGLAFENWNDLYNYLTERGHKQLDILSLGLIKKKENRFYDTFRNRIIFPIKDVRGQVIAFGGRAIDDKLPKYLNSPDSASFHKGKNLYGLIPEEIRKKEYVILMEGYIDVLRALSKGIKNVVASLGTSFTKDQATLISKYTKNVIICFDKDEAGRTATLKTILILKKLSFNVKVLDLVNFKDPDELLKEQGPVKFRESIKNSLEAFDYFYDFQSKNLNLEDVIDKKKLITSLTNFFACLNDLDRNIYLDKLSLVLKIDKDVLKNHYIVKDELTSKQLSNVDETEKKKSLIKLEEQTLIALVLSNKIDTLLESFYTNSKNTEEFNIIIKNFLNKTIDERKAYLYASGLEYLLKELDKDFNKEDFLKEIIYGWKKRYKKNNLSFIESKIFYASNEDKLNLIEEYYNAKREEDVS